MRNGQLSWRDSWREQPHLLQDRFELAASGISSLVQILMQENACMNLRCITAGWAAELA